MYGSRHANPDRLPVLVEAVAAHRGVRVQLGRGDPGGELGLGAPLAQAERHAPEAPPAGLGMARRVELVGAVEQRALLVVEARRLPAQVTGAVHQVRLDPLGDLA
jgi:hypothetical protein